MGGAFFDPSILTSCPQLRPPSPYSSYNYVSKDDRLPMTRMVPGIHAGRIHFGVANAGIPFPPKVSPVPL